MKTSLILDGNNILYKAYHVIKNKKLIEDVDVTSIEHFFRMVNSYVEKTNPSEIYFTWDKKLNKNGINFRKELVDYKGTREVDSTVLNRIYNTTNKIIEIVEALGSKTILPYSLEADDVIYFLSKTLEGNKIIVTGDKDLFQLVSEDTNIYYSNKNILLTLENFEEEVGISKDNFIDYKCILGDTSDNIKGLYKYGPSKSKKLAESKNWSILDDDQIKVLETNRILMDLSFGPKNNSDEWNSYKEQLEKSSSIFDKEKLSLIFKGLDIINYQKYIQFWESKNNDNILETWFKFS